MSRKTLYIIIIILVIILIGGGIYVYRVVSQSDTVVSNEDPFFGKPAYKVPELGAVYTDEIYKFSLKLPEDFKARKSQVDNTYVVVLENTNTEGIQIKISPFDSGETKILTSDMIRRDIPDMQIFDEQIIEIGAYHKGVAFRSNNESFSGRSREVWFIFKGNLYQISTYDRFDELLKDIFATWKFE
jgi:hypothetical protein